MAQTLMFYLAAFLCIGSALVVAFSRNIIYSAVSLLFSFVGVAGIYAVLAADFLAITQILIYVGGILVLILFAVMLTNAIGETRSSNRSSSKIFGTLLALVIFAALSVLAVTMPWKGMDNPNANSAGPMTRAIGDALLGPYLLPFEVVSVLLVVAMIGAVVIARKESASTDVKS